MSNIEHLETSRVAEALGVDVRTIHRWVEAGRITPVYKLPGLRGPYLFTAAEVERVQQEAAS